MGGVVAAVGTFVGLAKVTIFCLLLHFCCGEQLGSCNRSDSGCSTIWEIISCNQNFSTYANIVRSPGVEGASVLNNTDLSLTVFLPTNGAFTKPNVVQLPGGRTVEQSSTDIKQQLVLVEMLLGKWTQSDLLFAGTVPTALSYAIMDTLGYPLPINFTVGPTGGLLVQIVKNFEVPVVDTYEACNGIVYVVDTFWITWFQFGNGSAHPGVSEPLYKNAIFHEQPYCDEPFHELLNSAVLMNGQTGRYEDYAKLLSDESVTGRDVSVTIVLPAFSERVNQRDLLHGMLIGGFCPYSLAVRGKFPTLLGLYEGSDDHVTFGVLPNGTMTVESHGIVATVLDYYTTCQSTIVYVDRPLGVAANSLDSNDLTEEEVEGLIAALSNWTAVPINCTKPLPSFSAARSTVLPTTPAVALDYDQVTAARSAAPRAKVPTATNNATSSEGGDEEGGSGVPVVAIAVPVAIGGALLLGAGVFGWWYMRKKRGNKPGKGSKNKQVDASTRGTHIVDAESGSFDTRSSLEDTAQETSFAQRNSNSFLQVLSDGGNRGWLIQSDELHTCKKIGGGSFGEVHLCKWKGTMVAAKRLPMPHAFDEANTMQKAAAALEKEVSILASLRHPNVVLLLGVCLEPPSLVTEFCERGSLFKVVQDAVHDTHKMSQLTWRRRIQLALDAAVGMDFLHSRNPPIIHNDLKSPNVLVDAHWRVKVADFGLSRILDPCTTVTTAMEVNPRWVAPEVINSPQQYSKASDVYSFAIILWELLTLEEPFSGMTSLQVMYAVVHKGLRPPVPENLDATFPGIDKYVALMRSCWEADPTARPTFEEIAAKLREMKAEILGSSLKSQASSAMSEAMSRELSANRAQSGVSSGGVIISQDSPPPVSNSSNDMKVLTSNGGN